jgi:hypothetical protein
MQTEQSGSESTALSTKSEARRRWEVLRIVLGIMCLLGAFAHVALGVMAPEIHHQFVNQARGSLLDPLAVARRAIPRDFATAGNPLRD